MSALRVCRCDSPIKADLLPQRRTSNPIISQKKTNTVVRRGSKRTDLDMSQQLIAVKAEKQLAKQRWVDAQRTNPTPDYQVTSIKYAVAESMLFHHRNNSNVLASMLDNEADKKGTNKTGKKPITCCGLPKHYVNVLMDDIELITKLDGAQAALTSIRALPLWRLAKQQ